jgi:glutamate/tyrosine decarboxylase-like PLP-dependent enzyme
VRSADAHRRAMTIAASYLPPVREGERDPSHYVPELSRRGRGFATWAMLRHLGREGVAAMVERHCRLCRQMADELGAEPGVEVMNEVVLNQAVVRFGADRPDEESDRLTRRVIEGVQADGTCFVGGASWRGRWVMRLSVVNHSTSEADARQSVEAIKRVWRSLPAATT